MLNDDKNAVIYIHGYNVGFEDAAIRAAQLGVDLKIPLMAFFSWPSQGETKDYMADEASIEASEKHLKFFITQFIQKIGAENIHIIAHSMGNRGLLRCLDKIVTENKDQGVFVCNIILAAPDIDRRTFLNLADVYKECSHNTTMYISSKDRALKASGFLHKFKRAGMKPPVTVVEGIDTVDASQVDFSLLGHGYYAESKELLNDIYHIIHNNLKPEDRFSLERAQSAAGKRLRYWVFKE